MLAIVMMLDRYILIVFPLRYHDHLIVKTARIIYAVLFAWSSALAMSLSIYFAWPLRPRNLTYFALVWCITCIGAIIAFYLIETLDDRS